MDELPRSCTMITLRRRWGVRYARMGNLLLPLAFVPRIRAAVREAPPDTRAALRPAPLDTRAAAANNEVTLINGTPDDHHG